MILLCRKSSVYIKNDVCVEHECNFFSRVDAMIEIKIMLIIIADLWWFLVFESSAEFRKWGLLRVIRSHNMVIMIMGWSWSWELRRMINYYNWCEI